MDEDASRDPVVLNPQDPDFQPIVASSRTAAAEAKPGAASIASPDAKSTASESKTNAAKELHVSAPSKAYTCDACPHCDDLCIWAGCASCNAKEAAIREAGRTPGPRDGKYTMCQVRRHNRREDLWLVAHGIVYDATEFLSKHPGGDRSIVRHGGTDSSVDFDFHSSAAKGLWKDLRIGKVVPCPKDGGGGSCAIM